MRAVLLDREDGRGTYGRKVEVNRPSLGEKRFMETCSRIPDIIEDMDREAKAGRSEAKHTLVLSSQPGSTWVDYRHKLILRS